VHGPRAGHPVPAGVGQPHLLAIDGGLLPRVEVGRRRTWTLAAPPGTGVDDDRGDRSLGALPERHGQRPEQLAQRSFELRAGRGGGSGDGEQGAGLSRGEPGQVGARAADQLPPARTAPSAALPTYRTPLAPGNVAPQLLRAVDDAHQLALRLRHACRTE